MNQLTSSSPDVQKRFFAFANVSGKTIPPFAAMQIVGHPDTWKAAQSDPSLDDVAKSFAKISSLETTGQFDRGSQLHCDQIGLAGEFLQDPAFVAFNSESSVSANGSGRCFIAEYPARALCRHNPMWTASYAVRRNCWHLASVFGRFGAFRSAFTTRQGVTVEVPANELTTEGAFSNNAAGSTRSVRTMVLGVVPGQREPWIPGVVARWNISGKGSFPITNVSWNSLSRYSLPFVLFDDIVYGASDTLSFRIPGEYLVSLEGILRVKQSAPAQGLRIPYKIGIVGKTSEDQARLDFGSYLSPSLAILRCHRTDSLSSWYQITAMPEAGELLWSRHRFSARMLIKVTKAPASICIEQSQSPYVESVAPGILESVFLTDSISRSGAVSFLNPIMSYWQVAPNLAWYGGYSSVGLGNIPVLDYDPGIPFQPTWMMGLAFCDIADGIITI